MGFRGEGPGWMRSGEGRRRQAPGRTRAGAGLSLGGAPRRSWRPTSRPRRSRSPGSPLNLEGAGEGRTRDGLRCDPARGQASRRSIGPGWVGCGQARASRARGWGSGPVRSSQVNYHGSRSGRCSPTVSQWSTYPSHSPQAASFACSHCVSQRRRAGLWVKRSQITQKRETSRRTASGRLGWGEGGRGPHAAQV